MQKKLFIVALIACGYAVDTYSATPGSPPRAEGAPAEIPAPPPPLQITTPSTSALITATTGATTSTAASSSSSVSSSSSSSSSGVSISSSSASPTKPHRTKKSFVPMRVDGFEFTPAVVAMELRRTQEAIAGLQRADEKIFHAVDNLSFAMTDRPATITPLLQRMPSAHAPSSAMEINGKRLADGAHSNGLSSGSVTTLHSLSSSPVTPTRHDSPLSSQATPPASASVPGGAPHSAPPSPVRTLPATNAGNTNASSSGSSLGNYLTARNGMIAGGAVVVVTVGYFGYKHREAIKARVKSTQFYKKYFVTQPAACEPAAPPKI